ncbi:hypothetical protein ED236_09190 [Pseudomethylobacillus aquaticus]|uniref:Flagellar biosynthesis protein FlhB n=1 Tax=Pseudomethylobacillus aquaticus TaxID=2676064 RepID=A0A3N0V026_9PROT|nr:hypothetical protein [Pseudomethylobacillus aquaticus]ROH85894.1 hypothetical protein ED236_09190 [Pseudomethylobacillus aquaticus]
MTIKKIVGLAYKKEQAKLPSVILKASGLFADKVVQEFHNESQPHKLIKDGKLVDRLFSLPTESEISADLYELVAILLVHVYAVEAKLKGNLHD